MNRMALAVFSSLLTLLLVACTPTSKAAPSSNNEPEATKVTAPVAVDAQLGDGQAHVTVRFSAPANNVQINVHGVDGLVVKSAGTPVDGATFTESSVTSFDVAFTPGPGRSHLVVAVNGSFRGAQRSSVSSFAVGTPSPEQQQSVGNTVTDDKGQTIKIMPAGGDTK